jgi:hypothetical protein
MADKTYNGIQFPNKTSGQGRDADPGFMRLYFKNGNIFVVDENSVDTKLTGVAETDPVFMASAASNITNTNISNWNSAFSWGDHAIQGYLTSVALNNVSDVTLTSPSNGQVLKYNGTIWVNAADEGGTGGAYTNSDVDTHLNTGTATTGEVLSWNGADYDWIAATGGGATGVTIKAQGTSTADTSAGVVDVTWDSPSITGTSFTISGADITCNVDGTYVFMFAAVIDFANRSELTIQVELDTGSGYVAQAGEIMADYVTRDANQNEGGVSMSTAFELTAGDRIKLTAVSVIDGTGTATLVPTGTRVIIMSPRGAAGAQGPAGETWVALTQAEYNALTPVATTLYLITG